MDILTIIIHNLIIIFGETFGGFAIFIGLLRIINHNSKQMLANHGGNVSQIIFGGLGIIVHEFSHLITAIIFAHQINSFRLLKIPHPPMDNTLGYVNHSFNPHSVYQKFGNLWIGIAPVIGCSLVIILLINFLTPGLLNFLANLGQNKMPPFEWWHLILLILLVTNISIGGFDLSNEDLKNAKAGLPMAIIIVTISVISLTLLKQGPLMLSWIQQGMSIILNIFLLSLVVSIGANLIIRLANF